VARAVAALTRAAEKAERREGINEADRFYARALELVDEEEHETALDLRLRRCRTLVALGELREAGEQLLAVEADTAALGLVDLRCAALVALANVDRKQGRALEARRRLDEATALAAGSADRVLRIRATYELAGLRAWSEAAVDAALEQLRGGLALAEELDHRSLRIEGHMRMGGLLFNVGGLAEAEEHLARATALASEVGSFRDEARATSMLGFVRYYRGAVEDSERLALQALDWLERTCDSYLQLQNLRALAKYALAKGDAALAEERLRVALPPALEAGGWLVFELYRYLTEALVRQERSEEARELVEFAGRHVPEEDAYARAAYRLAEASVATAQGDQERASACFEDALRLLEEQSLLTDLGEARIGYARALRRFGDREGAERQLWRARETFAAMEAQALLAEIDGELAGLAREAGVLRPLALPEVSGGA